MQMTQLAAALLAAVAAGCVAYVFLYPLLSGEARAEKRQKAFAGPVERRGDRGLAATVSRRDQVAQSLKDIEAKEKARHKLTLDLRITQAGLTWSKPRYFIISAVMGLVLALVALLVGGPPLAALGALFVGGFGLPRWYLGFRRKRRIKAFLNELPNAIDVIIRGARSGLPLGDCLRMIATDAAEPVRGEFRRVIESQTVGIPLGEAVMKIYERMPVPEANFFGIVVAIQTKAGGNLSEALGNLSKVLRERKKLAGKIVAMSQEAKVSAAIIGCLPPMVGIMTYLSSPTYIELLWKTQVGTMMLVLSALWMATGIFVMKKMINFDH